MHLFWVYRGRSTECLRNTPSALWGLHARSCVVVPTALLVTVEVAMPSYPISSASAHSAAAPVRYRVVVLVSALRTPMCHAPGRRPHHGMRSFRRYFLQLLFLP